MSSDYMKYNLFGKTFLQKIVLNPPFKYEFPVSEQACLLFVRGGEIQYQNKDIQIDIPVEYSLFLNCLTSGKEIHHTYIKDICEIVIITFHPDILKKIYDKELPLIFYSNNKTSNQSSGRINNDVLIKKYIEGLMFYFENPSLINDEILILKLKEIIILVSQTQDAETIQVILSQLFSPTIYSFKQIVEAHLFSQLTIDELAQYTNLSTSSFKREFAKRYNDTPANYIKTKKLEKAAELLLISEERITDIAYDCGFNDLANFTKNFTKKYRTSPSQFRLNQMDK